VVKESRRVPFLPYDFIKTPPLPYWNLSGSMDENKLWLRENREYLRIIP
jgi:hypothetical protein